MTRGILLLIDRNVAIQPAAGSGSPDRRVLSQIAAERLQGGWPNTSRRSLVVIQQATELWTPTDSALASTKCPALDEPILEALMISLAMIVIDEFLEGPSEMALPGCPRFLRALWIRV